MTQVPAAMYDLARRVLRHEAAGREDVETLVDAAERALQKLCPHVTQLVGTNGWRALLARALHLAKGEFRVLSAVTVRMEPPGLTEGLRESLHGAAPAQAALSLAGMLARLIWLLANFIGDSLALRLVHDIWPEVPLGAAMPGEEETRR